MSLPPANTTPVDNVGCGQLIGSGITQTTPYPSQSVQTLSEKVYIGLDLTPFAFNLREKVLGPSGANLQYINKETDAQISLRGIGSLYIEPNTNSELQEPLHLLLEHQCQENINCAILLTKNLIETLHKEFQHFQQNIELQELLSNIPPSNVQISEAPSDTSVTALPFLHHQLPIMQQQQQLIPQNNLQMQIAPNGLILQQTPNYAANVQLPLMQTSLLPMKSTNRIQLQLSQANPANPQLSTLLAAHNTPLLLNTQTPPIQYQQYIQQTTRDLQGNQYITLQPVIQHTHIPSQSQQQFVTVQHGNATYMIPHGSAIIQPTPASHLPIIHHHHQLPSTYLNPTQLQVQLPTVNIQQVPVRSSVSQLPNRAQLSSSETISNSALDTLPTSSTSVLLDDIASVISNSTEDVVTELKLYEGINPVARVSGVDDNMDHPSDAQPKYVTCTNVPRQHMNCFSLPSHNMQQFIGGNSLSIPTRSVFPDSASNERVNFVGNSQLIQVPANGRTSIMGLQQLQSIAQHQQHLPIAVTFPQPVIQQSTQQFVEIQPPPPSSQQQFGIIQTNNFNGEKVLPQRHQQQQQLHLQQQQHLFHYSQQEEPKQQQEQELQKQQQIYLDVTSTTKTKRLNRRSSQKRRKPNCEPGENCGVEGPSPNQKIRNGARQRNDTADGSMSTALITAKPNLF